jgi:hypothetical protein
MNKDRPKLKYYIDDKNTIDFILKRKGINGVIEEYDAEVVPFPLSDSYKRAGNFYIGSKFYYVMTDGTTLLLPHNYLPTFDNDYHWFSEKEYRAIADTINFFGYKSIPPFLLKRYLWQSITKELIEIRRSRIKNDPKGS